MISIKRWFELKFDDKDIRNNRLRDFSLDHHAKASALSNAAFSDYLTELSAAIIALSKELGDVEFTLAILEGTTMGVDVVIEKLKETMSGKYVNIAAALGEKSIAMHEIYPGGRTEYTKITKLEMPTVVDRLEQMAIRHANALGDDLSTLLASYKVLWNAARTLQTNQKAAVSTDRTERDVARPVLEEVLTWGIHMVGVNLRNQPLVGCQSLQ